MENARLPLADALQELPAQMNSQPSALMVLARPPLLNVPATSNAQSSSHTDVVLVNADQEPKIAQPWSSAHLKCQSNAKTKAASDLRSTVLKPPLMSAERVLSDALMAHAPLLNLSAQPWLLALRDKSDAGTTNARPALTSAQQSLMTLWFAQPTLQFAALIAHAEQRLPIAQLQLSAQLKSQFFAMTETAVNQARTATLTLDALSVPRDAQTDHALEKPTLAVPQSPALPLLHTDALI